MASLDPFAVQIAHKEGETHKILGSGAVVALRLVLTARHVLKAPNENLRVRLSATAEPMKVVARWTSEDEALDVALLEVEKDLLGPQDQAVKFDPRKLDNAENWAASGYPVLLKDKPSKALHSVAGWTLPTAADADNCELDVRRDPCGWAGLSGAAVRVGDVVVAVVRSVPEGWNGGRLHATPVGRFINAPWYVTALGLGDAYKALQDEATKLTNEIRDLLAPWSELRKRLKEALQAPSEDAAELAGALVRQEALKVVRALRTAGEDLEESRAPLGEREALWLILERVLPHAINWQQTILQARQRVWECRCRNQPEPSQFELNFRTETVAEIVLAGLDGRRCAFVPMDGGPQLAGVGFLSWPAASAAPIRQTQDSVRESMVLKLARELGVQHAWVVESLAKATGAPLFSTPEGVLRAIERRLEATLEDRQASPRRRHLLVIDDALDAVDGPGAGLQAWKVVQAALGTRLPSLRLVHLTGSPTQLDSETAIAARVEALYNKAKRPS